MSGVGYEFIIEVPVEVLGRVKQAVNIAMSVSMFYDCRLIDPLFNDVLSRLSRAYVTPVPKVNQEPVLSGNVDYDVFSDLKKSCIRFFADKVKPFGVPKELPESDVMGIAELILASDFDNVSLKTERDLMQLSNDKYIILDSVLHDKGVITHYLNAARLV